jgi:Alpha/beta hydrolase domain
MLGACTFAANPLPSSDTMRALVVALDEWIHQGTVPPVSRYPRLSDRTLVSATRSATGFPDIPGAAFAEGLANPQFDYDFGPAFVADDVSGILSVLPPTIKHVIPAWVARVNGDGNEEVGVRSVLSQVPLGTYLGWNITASGFFKGQRCGWIGGYLPFAKTVAERVAAGDPRPSLEERYASHSRYVDEVRAAAQRNVAERFLLPEDAERLVREATSSEILPRK